MVSITPYTPYSTVRIAAKQVPNLIRFHIYQNTEIPIFTQIVDQYSEIKRQLKNIL